MWKQLKDSQYFLLFTKDLEYELCITDYFYIWTTLYSEKAFLANLKDNNFGLELDNDGLELENNKKFIKKGLHLLTNSDKLKEFRAVKEENGKSLSISMTISFGYNFSLKCKLSKGSEELFFQKVTCMLLRTISDLRSSENQLRQLLIKKDYEVEQYKCEGVKLSLRHAITEAFDDEKHRKKHNLYEENFGRTDIPTTIIVKCNDLLQRNNLKQEKKDPVKSENLETPKPVLKTQPGPWVSEEPCVQVKQEPVVCKQEVKRSELSSNIQRKRHKKFNL